MVEVIVMQAEITGTRHFNLLLSHPFPAEFQNTNPKIPRTGEHKGLRRSTRDVEKTEGELGVKSPRWLGH